MQTIVIISLVFLSIWIVTVLGFWLEHRSRVAIESQFRALLGQMAGTSAKVANQAADMGLHAVIKEQIRPLVHSVDPKWLNEKEGRWKILEKFIENNPGVPWEHADRALQAVVKEVNG